MHPVDPPHSVLREKNPGINQCGEKGGGGGYYIPSGSVDLNNSKPMS